MNLMASFYAGKDSCSFPLPADEIETLELRFGSTGVLETIFDVKEFGVSTPVAKVQLAEAVEELLQEIDTIDVGMGTFKLSESMTKLKTFLVDTEGDTIVKIIS